jgi:peptidoglycan/LPS O-acetylase OafA/YrhL
VTTSRGVSRLVYIDSLRGIASLAVAVFFHYRHFSSLFQPGGAPPRSAPFYTLLRPLYNYGYLAVDVFFILSGFIFCHVYAESIRSRRVTAWKFFVHRFSRLYPLHFATLCVTGVLVYAFRHQTGRFPVYQYNGLQDFVLNVLFLQSGVLDRGMSFNGPSWSLSIEALLYFCFFVWACRSGRLRWIAAILLAAVAMLLSGRTNGVPC